LFHSEPEIDRCFLASAAIRLASTANPSPPTNPAAIQASTTRVIWDFVLDRKPTKPAIGEVHLYISAYRSLRANGKHVADDEHSDHQFRINRASTHFRVKGREIGMNPRQIENRINLANWVIVRNCLTIPLTPAQAICTRGIRTGIESGYAPR
jgi:hypothetical protein